jgi:hypothetical protein
MKLFLAIVSEVRFSETSAAPRASLTYSQLQAITGLSRGMIRPALESLHTLVKLEHGEGRENAYSLHGYPAPGTGGWAMIPAAWLRKSAVLPKFSTRSELDRCALLLYMVLAAFRDNQSGAASIAYERIGGYTALTRNEVSQAMSRLVELGMVRVRSSRDPSQSDGYSYNRYFLVGLPERSESSGMIGEAVANQGVPAVGEGGGDEMVLPF